MYIFDLIYSIEFPVKKDGWGGGGNRVLKFVKVHQPMDVAMLKPSGKTLTISIGPGLPKDSRKSNLTISNTVCQEYLWI